MVKALTDMADDEARRFLKAHPDVESVEYLITDSNGVVRGKWAPPQSLAKAASAGIAMPLSLFGFDVWGRDVPAAGLSFETGDGDGVCRLVPGSIRRVPWARRPTAQALVSMHLDAGAPWTLDPRQQLAAAVERLARLGLRAVAAFELEFYLIDPERQGEALPVLSGTPGPERPNTYGLDDLAIYEDLFADIRAAAAVQGLPIDTIVSEAAAGQFEVNLRHKPDALGVADDAVMLKRLIVEIARRRGLRATFMAKPWIDRPGNGMHVHASLVDRDGVNVFADPARGTQRLEQAIAGLVDGMAASTLVFAPTFNAYRRLRPGAHAPTRASWGYNNRTVAIRVPNSEPYARRLEHRVAGADANPYLVMAAVLNGMADGLEREARVQPPVNGDDNVSAIPQLPRDMASAIATFETSDFVRRGFGTGWRKVFAAVKRAELAAFLDEITPLERSTYL
ncbi:glutamine synthetase family protein [Oharaeibacter diazotrophicus]|uniref:Glutamate--putrescine ligase n=1 Tax=Oharaeibacter diazotrophicus TaxID=1920512 RepID=A0A4R6RI60_9HYPH|nr:glutamine synthetase family protein [Oharaeibacter diazotrophicus]TDP85346.1 glutamate--putrescine ligase [Oharaeibacter diazotrophicus]BBE74316.1 gamma-glutamylputrescine synthetase PuuA [Pleomorphomonas sp. SM30]GLS75993.1 glutamine synthetase [Oharaeibacter diazotrophicus]